MHPHNVCLVSKEKGDVPTEHVSHISGMRVSFLFNMNKKEYLQNILDEMLLASACNGHPAGPAQEAPRGAQAI
jgi:hypothetical protein